MRLRTMLLVAAASGLLSTSYAVADGTAAEDEDVQRGCDRKGPKGDARKAFMKTCLSGK